MLKRRIENPSATLVALVLNVVYEVCSPLDHRSSPHSAMERLRSYIPITRYMVRGGSRSNPQFIRFMTAQVMFRDFDELFGRFKRERRLDENSLDENSKASGLKMKSKNTIVQPWPMRLKENATQREFDVLLASGHVGSERYVESKNAA